MTLWDVHAHSNELLSGCEVDFIETMQVDIKDEPIPQLAVGDELHIDWPQGGGAKGEVIAVTEETVTIAIEGTEYSIRPAKPEDMANPTQGGVLRVNPWFVI